MAQTISHEAAVQVKHDPKQDAYKEKLMSLLERSHDQLVELEDDLQELAMIIDPAPRPLPETVNPAALMSSLLLRDEAEAVQKGAEAFGRTVEEFHRAAKRAQSLLDGGRNARAWKVVLERLEGETFSHVEAVHNATASLLRHMRTVAALVTFAQADALPETIDEEAGNE